MPKDAANSLTEMVGRNLREWRRRKLLTQNELAALGRNGGLDWSRSVVAAIENGNRSLEVDEWVALALVGGPLPAELLSGSSRARVQVGDRTYPMSAIRSVIVGPYERKVNYRTLRTLLVEEIVQGQGEAEYKAARRLGVTPEVIAATSFELWSHSFTSERNDRVQKQAHTGASSRTLQALRGHVARRMLDEIQTVLARESD